MVARKNPSRYFKQNTGGHTVVGRSELKVHSRFISVVLRFICCRKHQRFEVLKYNNNTDFIF